MVRLTGSTWEPSENTDRPSTRSYSSIVRSGTIDVFDIFAFAVFGVLLAAVVIVVVTLGQLPGQIAKQRNHPQAAAINVASWLGVATLGILWPFAMIWAYLKPFSAAANGANSDRESQSSASGDGQAQLAKMQTQVDSLQAALNKLTAK
ncbi:DUF3302 domain-containing protein [Rosistilla carotiformis]|uniref:DUF3302 domain-containing protein n=1 Tax=Rosistilla carotiformis TaxID=2528017 RepID=UPI0021BCB15F|nr:DUF3302 domain-containing protein [Rosistilla carotiformis]